MDVLLFELSAKIFIPPDLANKRGANGCWEIDEASKVLETIFWFESSFLAQ